MNEETRLGGTFTFPGTSLTVRRIGYGAMQLAGPGVFGPPKDRDAAIAVLREAVALGIDHIDTSDYYGPFVTNEIIREALQPYPENLVIVTKVGAVRGPDASWNPAMKPDELRRAVEDNLERLGLDSIDVVNLRFMGGEGGMGPAEGSIARELEVLVRIKDEGLLKSIGLSNVTRTQIAEAREMTDIVCVQNLYNLVHRHDDEMIDELADAGIAFVPFFPIGGFSPIQSDSLSRIAKEIGATPMQAALAWLLRRSPNILLIPGTSSIAHLRENVASADFELSPETFTALDAIGR